MKLIPLEISSTYVQKNLAVNHTLADGINELIDNSIDARVAGEKLQVSIDLRSENPTYVDNGSGFENLEKLNECMKIGGTSKQPNGNDIGKFGIGFKSALTIIALSCAKDKEKPVIFRLTSKNVNGFECKKVIAFLPDGRTGFLNDYCANDEEDAIEGHGIKLVMENVYFSESCMIQINEQVRETYALTIKEYELIDIFINGRAVLPTKVESIFSRQNVKAKEVYVDDIRAEMRYILPFENKIDEQRTTENSALAFYSAETGRLLTKDGKYWKWFADHQLQPTVCGLRCAVFIPNNENAYKAFNISNGKNSIKYNAYHKKPIFYELKKELCNVYQSSVNSKKNKKEGIEIKHGRRVYRVDDRSSKNCVDEDVTGKNITIFNNPPLRYVHLIVALYEKGATTDEINNFYKNGYTE